MFELFAEPYRRFLVFCLYMLGGVLLLTPFAVWLLLFAWRKKDD